MMRWAALVLVVVAAAGCSNARRLANGKPLKNQSPNAILTQYGATAMEWDWLAMKLDAEVESEQRDGSFSATVRMARDSVIWVSISPALGVEVGLHAGVRGVDDRRRRDAQVEDLDRPVAVDPRLQRGVVRAEVELDQLAPPVVGNDAQHVKVVAGREGDLAVAQPPRAPRQGLDRGPLGV